MNKRADIVVIGAGIIGMSSAYFLARSGFRVIVVDRKHIGSGSTGKCIAGIRQQFSTPTSINLMKQSLALFKEMEGEFGFSIELYQGGYLLLAHSEELLEIFKANIEIQQREGVNVSLLSPEKALNIVPGLNIRGVFGAAYCPDDAKAYPFAVLRGYKNKISQQGGSFYLHNPVMNLEKQKHFLITLQDQTILESPRVLLAAGPWTAELGRMLKLDLPLFPERHEAIITERLPRLFDSMIVDYRRDGCYFNQLQSGHIIGCYTPYPNVPGIIEEASDEFMINIASRMTRLLPLLEDAAILRHWAGCYTMTPDGNPLVDETEIENLYLASGMCGHGFMFGPAIGKHLAHFILEGRWQMDFTEFALNRPFTSSESLK